jgi:hypothetical protein
MTCPSPRLTSFRIACLVPRFLYDTLLAHLTLKIGEHPLSDYELLGSLVTAPIDDSDDDGRQSDISDCRVYYDFVDLSNDKARLIRSAITDRGEPLRKAFLDPVILCEALYKSLNHASSYMSEITVPKHYYVRNVCATQTAGVISVPVSAIQHLREESVALKARLDDMKSEMDREISHLKAQLKAKNETIETLLAQLQEKHKSKHEALEAEVAHWTKLLQQSTRES